MDNPETISREEAALLGSFTGEMKRLLDLNTRKGPIVVEGEECAYHYLHYKIAEHALVLCDVSMRLKSGQAIGTRQKTAAIKACLDIANLAFIFKANIEAEKL